VEIIWQIRLVTLQTDQRPQLGIGQLRDPLLAAGHKVFSVIRRWTLTLRRWPMR
jgi:hypothetical protein